MGFNLNEFYDKTFFTVIGEVPSRSAPAPR